MAYERALNNHSIGTTHKMYDKAMSWLDVFQI